MVYKDGRSKHTPELLFCKNVKMKGRNFDTLVEDCLGEIRAQAFDEAGSLVSPAVCNFLSEQANEEIVPSIVAAAKPTLKRLLISTESLGHK
jgi:hypothetical protein